MDTRKIVVNGNTLSTTMRIKIINRSREKKKKKTPKKGKENRIKHLFYSIGGNFLKIPTGS